MNSDIKRIPYGVSDFKQLRRENLYYVDKSMYIDRLEQAGHFLFFIRPRRFGKSLFLNMLAAYYDIEGQQQWDELFGGLYVHEHPTRERGQYQVLKFDFSQASGDVDSLYNRLDAYMAIIMDNFVRKYAHYYHDCYLEDYERRKDFNDKLLYIGAQAREHGYPLYLIIDEYDNFTNNVLAEYGEAVYHKLTHATGFYRDLFKKFKPNFDRILMLGVSPVTMDDLTSGYNIARAITMDDRFNMMLGFSETEVREIIRYYQQAGLIRQSEDELVEDMRPWYDNYCFARASLQRDPKMFNSDMVLYYLNNVIDHGNRPEEIIDPNTRTDYKKMKKLISLDGTGTYRASIINRIAEQGYIIGTVEESFPAERLTDQHLFVSLLYYYGMLTIGDTIGAMLKLIIPNNNVRQQYYGYLMEEYQFIHPVDLSQLSMLFHYAALDGDWHPLFDYIGQAYHDATAVRSLIEGERNLQGFMNAYLTLTPYWMTQPETELAHGYCDFFLMPDLARYPMVQHSYIVELKYLKQDATEQDAQQQWAEAVEQIKHYAEDKKVRHYIRDTRLHLIIAQVRGYTWERVEEV
ncbi:MAG: AAA family ATPase [Prevotella sp.]|nr:AAA family ATPase [Prevotella sp.]